MRVFAVWILGLALLCGCTVQQATVNEVPRELQPIEVSDPPPLYETVGTLPLAEVLPYAPWLSMEPDTVSADTMGDILCDATLPDGTRIVCYWAPGTEYQILDYPAGRYAAAIL